jgi:hypothetical protein
MIELTKGVKNILIANVICFALTYLMFKLINIIEFTVYKKVCIAYI